MSSKESKYKSQLIATAHDVDSAIFQAKKKIAEDWLLQPGNNYCAIPYTHMAIESNGAIRPCCMGYPIPDLNIKGKSIGEALNDPKRQAFIDSFDKNAQHKLCNKCWGDNNRFMNRIKFSSREETIDTTIAAMLNQPEGRRRRLEWLEIKPGNRCNLKCRICGVHNSSQWTKDFYEYDKYLMFESNKRDEKWDDINRPFKDSQAFKYTQSCEWIDESDFWTNIDSLEEIRLIHFMGGEPLMVPEHFQMLEKLISDPSVDTKKIKIRYNTNGTYYPKPEEIQIWRQFGEVVASLSIDDVGDRFEYQRKLADWDEVKQNLIKFHKLREDNIFFHAGLDPAVSVFNVWWLQEIEEGFAEIGYRLNSGNNHFVNTGWNDPRVLPQEIKDDLIEKYQNGSEWQQVTAEFLRSPDPHPPESLHTMYSSVMFLDALRKEKYTFRDLNTELYDRLLPYIDLRSVTLLEPMTQKSYIEQTEKKYPGANE